MNLLAGIVAGWLLASGVWLAQSGWARRQRPKPWIRVAPYVRDVRPDVDMPSDSASAWAAAILDRAFGGQHSVAQRLARLGPSAGTVDGFRLRQLVWVSVGFAGATALALLVWSRGHGAVTPLLFFSVFGGVVGALACDQVLSAQVARRERALRAELPVVADLLALAVAAGESPIAGLERVVHVAHGALGDELAAVLADIRTGNSATAALDALVARTGVASVARFAEGLSVALERGTPVVEVLHAQAADVRESARRDLIEEGGRREVVMMLPVVFLLLPVTVVFAFFPGYVGLHLS